MQWVAHVAVARREQCLAVDVRVQVAPGSCPSPTLKWLVATCPGPTAHLLRTGFCSREGIPIRAQLTRVTTAIDAEALVDQVLLNKKRTFPVVLVSVASATQRPRLEAEELAAALCGLTDVYLLTRAT
ncbi:MAG: hypothetical protein KatS3mg061_2178 [Dehalococcoidia bacterium]|nr:MAG: hypothetical protein KatS3mg061_2178 [Dehalococcoidia bacterium]